jgi:thymidylate synthase (FAD)
MEPQTLIGKRVDVLDKGWIELIDLLPHPASEISGDLAIVNAARVSFMGESKGPEKDKKLLFYLLRNHHTWWQWVRHRTWNFNAQSGRYTPFEENDLYVPSVWRKQAASNKQASDGEVDSAVDTELTAKLNALYTQAYSLYEEALKAGVSREMARLFLPGFSVYYTWVAKVDAHNLMSFLRLRMAPDAQYEIRVYADAIYEHFFKPALPWTAEAFETHIVKKPTD